MYFTVYILYSKQRDNFYVGSTSEVIEDRIRKHNTNNQGITGRAGDWVLKYSEIFHSKSLAMKREKQIMNWKSRDMIEKLISNSEQG